MPVSEPPPSSADDTPGVPFFRTWRGVYGFVLVAFALTVALLTLFSRHYA